MSTPYLHRYRTGEYIQYMTDVLTLLAQEELYDLPLSVQMEALATRVADINAVFKQDRHSELTSIIADLDARRGRAITGLRGVTKHFTYHSDAAIATAAAALHATIAVHGHDISRLTYQEETAIIDSIVREWEEQETLRAAVHRLHLNSWLTELKESNAQFSARYLERVAETAQQPSRTVGEYRKAATQTYRTLVNHLKAHATLNPAAGYTGFLQELEVLATQYNQGIEHRTQPKDDTPELLPNTM